MNNPFKNTSPRLFKDSLKSKRFPKRGIKTFFKGGYDLQKRAIKCFKNYTAL